MKRTRQYIFSLFLVCLLGFVFTNPNPAQFERFIFKGNNQDETNAKNFKSVFSNIEQSKIFSRDNYGIFSIYEFSPSLIASMKVKPGTFIFDATDIRLRFIGIGNNFYGLSGSENGTKFIGGYLELCRVGAIDCRDFLKNYQL